MDTSVLEERLEQVESRFHAGRQMADLRRSELAQLQFERETLTKDISRAHDEVRTATAQVTEFRRMHALNDQDLPIDGRVDAVGLALGDVQVGGMMFRNGVVTAWDGDLLTFKHDDGIARVQIAKTSQPIQELMSNARPTGPRQDPLVINPSISEGVAVTSTNTPKSPAPTAAVAAQSAPPARHTSTSRHGRRGH